MNPSPHATPLPSASRRAVIWGVGVLVAVHSLLVMLWIMPSNPISDVVGRENLHTYIENPVVPFEQSWSIFAPVPRRGGENVKVRAVIGGDDGSTGRVTEWYDITADEDARILYLVNPSRVHSVTRRLGGDVNETMASFNQEQEGYVQQEFPATRERLRKRLVEANTTGYKGLRAIDDYLVTEEILVRFGTLYATARWGRGVTAVEFMVGHRMVPNYSKRNEVDFLDVPFSYRHIGLRAAAPVDAEARGAFDAYVRKAPTAASNGGG